MTLSSFTGSSAKNLSLAVPEMTIIFVVIAFFCVVGTSAAWFVFFYRTRRKQQASQIVENAALRRHSVARYEDLEDNLQNFSSSHAPLPNYQISKVHCEDDGSQSSSGKDSGTGDDLTVEVDGIGVPDPEEGRFFPRVLDYIKLYHVGCSMPHIFFSVCPSKCSFCFLESLMRYSRRKPEMESFSTFGTRAPTARLSQARLDVRNEVGDVISLAHHPGREFLTIPRKYPVPVPPPLVVLPRDHLDVNDARSGCQSTTSSSGYSTLGVRTPAGQAKNRSHSVNSESESSGGGLLATSGCDSGSSSDGLSTKGDESCQSERTQSSTRPISEHLATFVVTGSAPTTTQSTSDGGVVTSISTPV